MKVLLSKAQFGDKKNIPPEFSHLLRTALGEKRYVTVRLKNAGVAIELTETSERREAVRFEGRSLSSNLDVASLSRASEKVLLPFILNLTSIDLAPHAILSARHTNRSVGGVIFRNVVFALLRNEEIGFKPLYSLSGESTGAFFFVRQYLYVFKSIFQEPLLTNCKSPDALALLVTNIFHPADSFNNGLLNSGCRRISKNIRSVRSCSEAQEKLLSEIMTSREQLMKML